MNYVDKINQLRHREENTHGLSDELLQRFIGAHRSSKDRKGDSKVLHRLFEGVLMITPDQSGSDTDENEDYTALPHQDSPVLFTETDVTLPSCLDGSPRSRETDKEMDRARQLSHFCSSSSSGIGKVFEELMTIYDQLRAERLKQLQWEKELQDREKKLKQQEEALEKLVGLEEMLHSQMLSAEEKHQQEVLHLQHILRERTKENKRLKSSFETLKDLNDNMKKQLNDLSEQNKKLEHQSRRVQARLENLQRKYEHSAASRGCQKMNVKSTESVKLPKKDKTTSSGKHKGTPSVKLLSLLLDWVLDGQVYLSSTTGTSVKDIGQCLPPEILLNERCLKVLPLLADQLPHTPLSEPVLICNLLRLIHWALKYLDNSTQHVVLSATLRRIGEEVSKPRGHPLFEDLDLPDPYTEVTAGSCRKWPLSRSPCPQTRILSILIILRTVTQADVLAQTLDNLRTDLLCEESRELFLHYGGVCVLLPMLRSGRGGLQAPIIDILMQLTQQSCYLKPFMEACSCEEFFQTAFQLLKSPHLELPLLEKLCILLQKLSTIRKNRRFFESTSLYLHIQELQRKYGPTHTFLCLNLTSILHNLK